MDFTPTKNRPTIQYPLGWKFLLPISLVNPLLTKQTNNFLSTLFTVKEYYISRYYRLAETRERKKEPIL